jgi:hypothetical protein
MLRSMRAQAMQVRVSPSWSLWSGLAVMFGARWVHAAPE